MKQSTLRTISIVASVVPLLPNSTSLISKEAEGVHVRGQLENQDGDAVIWFDSFDSSVGICPNC